MRIGITGTMSAGKSSVSKIIKDLGFMVYDTDQIVHDYYEKDAVLYDQIIELLGKEIFNEKLEIDRKKIAYKVFNDKSLLEKLESLIFPQVRKDIETLSEDDALTFFEVPLLFEAQYDDIFDFIIVVDAKEKTRIQRAMNKGLELEDIENRMKRQLSAKEKRNRADFIIENNHDMESLKEEVQEVLEIIKLERAKSWIKT